MQDDAKIVEFQTLYERVYGEAICSQRAREMAQRLLTLYDLLLHHLYVPNSADPIVP